MFIEPEKTLKQMYLEETFDKETLLLIEKDIHRNRFIA
jgi:hypothetical protein